MQGADEGLDSVVARERVRELRDELHSLEREIHGTETRVAIEAAEQRAACALDDLERERAKSATLEQVIEQLQDSNISLQRKWLTSRTNVRAEHPIAAEAAEVDVIVVDRGGDASCGASAAASEGDANRTESAQAAFRGGIDSTLPLGNEACSSSVTEAATSAASSQPACDHPPATRRCGASGSLLVWLGSATVRDVRGQQCPEPEPSEAEIDKPTVVSGLDSVEAAFFVRLFFRIEGAGDGAGAVMEDLFAPINSHLARHAGGGCGAAKLEWRHPLLLHVPPIEHGGADLHVELLRADWMGDGECVATAICPLGALTALSTQAISASLLPAAGDAGVSASLELELELRPTELGLAGIDANDAAVTSNAVSPNPMYGGALPPPVAQSRSRSRSFGAVSGNCPTRQAENENAPLEAILRLSRWNRLLACSQSLLDLPAPARRRLLSAGVPAQHRALAWTSCAGACSLRDKYAALVAQEAKVGDQPTSSSQLSSAQRDIQKDLLRTFPEHPSFTAREGGLVPALSRILLAHARHLPEVGYCQGLNFVVATLLLHTDEATAFGLLVQLTQRLIPGFHTPQMEGLHEAQDALVIALSRHLPELSQAMDEHSVPIREISTEWYLCAYVNVLRPETVVRVWDVLFDGGVEVMLRAAVSACALAGTALLAHLSRTTDGDEEHVDAHGPNVLLALLLDHPADALLARMAERSLVAECTDALQQLKLRTSPRAVG